MRVELLVPDAPPPQATPDDDGSAAFAQTLDAVAAVLEGANRAEDAFAKGHGTLQAAVYERARADVALAVATATAQRTAQAMQSVFSMQV
jgi:flagellar hook-basal body complex protein FliE